MSLPLLIQFLLCPLVLLSLLRTTAPYGRHHAGGWGPRLPNRLAWFLMELPALGAITYWVLASPAGRSAAALVPLGFWVFHYAYRTFVFPALMRPAGRTFPALLVVFAVLFNLLNGFNNAHAVLANAVVPPPWEHWHFWVGAAVFSAGFIVHVHADHVIRRLRRPGSSGYAIPHGGLFRRVSSPNYLGEIVQWTGWAILTWSLAGLAFALFTVCNLAPRALSNQAWYRDRFPDYPPERRALIPGIL
ncbi:MAG: DUF1295 domain-containing protein [Xanthomonadales bacterium]|nr:DUF1295 domain-containing protein [Xanthomonadales bacterium]